MKKLLTPTPLIAVEVPINSLMYSQYTDGTISYYLDKGIAERKYIKVLPPKSDFETIGVVIKDKLYFDCEPYLEYSGEYYDGKLFWCYGQEKDKYSHENEAFLSLLESHSLSLDKKYLIIKPKN